MTFQDVTHFSQTWGLAFLFVLFLGVLVYALRPSAGSKFKDAAQIPFKED